MGKNIRQNIFPHYLLIIFIRKKHEMNYTLQVFGQIIRNSLFSRITMKRRYLSISMQRRTGDYEYEDPKSEDEIVNITYITRDGTEKKIRGKVGDNVMYLAHRYNIEIEGACEASLACCTCHVYVDEQFYEKLPTPVEDEEDMLDMAPLLKPNSRLSCQIILKKELDGIVVALPKITRNFYVDGHVPEPH